MVAPAVIQARECHARVLIYRCPDGTFEGEGIDAGLAASAPDVGSLLIELSRSAEALHAAAEKHGLPFRFTPHKRDLKLWNERTAVKADEDGRMLVHRAVLWREYPVFAPPKPAGRRAAARPVRRRREVFTYELSAAGA